VSELNLGGGMGIAYLGDDDPLQVDQMAKALLGILVEECQRVQFPVPRLLVEPGRAIIGPAGITVYEVGTTKDVDVSDDLVRRYISVDGGMSDNIRTALYGAEYTVALASRNSNAELVDSRVVGKHCETGDIVIRDAQMFADIVPGDLLAVAATGAYCRAMASNYNHIVRPAVVAVRNGESEVVLRRETLEDLLAFDVGAN
jgi:diaminopimelate decarboxylase